MSLSGPYATIRRILYSTPLLCACVCVFLDLGLGNKSVFAEPTRLKPQITLPPLPPSASTSKKVSTGKINANLQQTFTLKSFAELWMLHNAYAALSPETVWQEYRKAIEVWSQHPSVSLHSASHVEDFRETLRTSNGTNKAVMDKYIGLLQTIYPKNSSTDPDHSLVASAKHYAAELEKNPNSPAAINGYGSLAKSYSDEIQAHPQLKDHAPKLDKINELCLDWASDLDNPKKSQDSEQGVLDNYSAFITAYARILKKEDVDATASATQAAVTLVTTVNTEVPKGLVPQVTCSLPPRKPLQVKTSPNSPTHDKISKLFSQASQDRTQLNNLRKNGIEHFLEVLKKAPPGTQPDIAPVTAALTKANKEFVATIIHEEVEKLAEQGFQKRPFSVFTMGSMPRHESGIYTDLEIGFIIQENTPENQKYFAKLSQRLADRIHVLGEEDGMHLDIADNSPIYNQFSHRYIDHKEGVKQLLSAIENRQFKNIPNRGSRLLVATPDRLAKYLDVSQIDQIREEDAKNLNKGLTQEEEMHLKLAMIQNDDDYYGKDDYLERKEGKPKTPQKADRFWRDRANKPFFMKEMQQLHELPNMFRNIDVLYELPKSLKNPQLGEPKPGQEVGLFDEYVKHRNTTLSSKAKATKWPGVKTVRENIAYQQFEKDLQKTIKRGFVHGELDSKLDIKRDLYRFTEQFFTNLGFFYNVKTQNTVEIAQELEKLGVMDKTLVHQSRDLMNFLMELRLKTQVKFKKQGKAIYFDETKFKKDIAELDEDILKNEKLITSLNARQTTHPSSFVEEQISKKEEEIKLAKTQLNEMKEMNAETIFEPKDIERLKDYLPVFKQLSEFGISWIDQQKGKPATPDK